jgi:DnaJ-class molecular chaperone
VYGGQDYVPDVAMRKMRKGRRKKKRFCNEMDDMEKGYGSDMYGSSNFDQMKNKVHCSVCHGEGHTMNRHKQWPKQNPRACAAAGRSHRSRPTVIVEVTHMSNIEKIIFYVAMYYYNILYT